MNELFAHPYQLNLAKVTFGQTDKGFDLLVDTGSTWNWVNSCGVGEIGACPSFFMDMRKQTNMHCTGKTKFIKYGIGSVEGEICNINIGFLGLDYQAKMPFIANTRTYSGSKPKYDGILGLGPKDESAGPLIMDFLFGEGHFSI